VVPRGEIFTSHYLYPPYTEPVNIILVKLSTEDVRTTVSGIEREWMALFPDTTFDYFFLDTYFDTFYKEEQQFAKVFAFFAVIGILISCLGLFGLSLFDTTNRTKEIGIRKTLGASVRNLIWLFSKDYIKLVLVSTVLGVPLGIMLLNEWLQNYPQHINLGADAIILTLSLMLCIALVTVGYHTWRTAHTDPVVSLRNE
jgi:putative ABC transport system permease protein